METQAPTLRILIPTDFTVSSLQLVRDVMERTTASFGVLYLCCGVLPPTSITELLFYSRRKVLTGLQSKEFCDALEILRTTYASRLTVITVDIVPENTVSYMTQYLKALHVGVLGLPEDYVFQAQNSNHIDIVPALRKTEIPVLTLQKQARSATSVARVADLFAVRGDGHEALPSR